MIMQNIILQPVLFQPAKEIISLLVKILSEGFNASIVTASQIKDLKDKRSNQLLDKQRNQWKSNDILQWLSYKYKPSNSKKILALCDFDAYYGSLNSVFGEVYLSDRHFHAFLYQTVYYFEVRSSSDGDIDCIEVCEVPIL